MPLSSYIASVRSKIGHDLLMLPAVAAIIQNAEGHVLLQRRSDDGSWSLPAGAIEPGESPKDAVIREVLEETGLHVDVVGVAGVFGGQVFRQKYPNGDEVEYTVVVFRCVATGGALGGLDDETAGLSYFPPDTMPPLATRYPVSLFLNAASAPMF